MYGLNRLLLAIFFVGCAQEPQQNIEALKQQFLDASKGREAQIAAGRQLLVDEAGLDFVVEQYWKGQRTVIQSLVTQLTGAQSELATKLLAELMVAAKGEEMLAFEAQLVALGGAAVPALVRVGHKDVDWQSAMQILDALGKLKAPEGIEVMRRFLAHPNDWVRIAAAHALGDVGGVVVVEPLTGALEDTSETVVAAAVIALGKSGERSAVSKCAVLLAHSNPRLRSAAVSAIGRLGGADARRLLKPMLKDEDSGVKYKAERALKELN